MAARRAGERAPQAAGAAVKAPVGSVGCTQGTQVTQAGCRLGGRLGGQGGVPVGPGNARVGVLMTQTGTVTQARARSGLTDSRFKCCSSSPRELLQLSMLQLRNKGSMAMPKTPELGRARPRFERRTG